ncbi:hypothetical protein BSL78_00474 [Apostichopus japonicus]|uniref:Fe2OG dioxygenase domain-containing protein n=1 Tax=Stichopus japonicus TaxID=307972 RepID=A0A2G8LQP1_STIJA|nr:hypothetical protein BSL78_00474 [Apostichopus japonicus]
MDTSKCVPIVDFSGYGLHTETPVESKLQTLADEIHEAFVTIGFVHLKNVGIPLETIEQAFQVSKGFFSLGSSEKAKYKSGDWIKDSFHGYVPPDLEGLDTDYGQKDMKESFNLRPIIKETDSNEFPEIPDVPKMKASLVDLYQNCKVLHQRILEIMAKGLRLKDTMALASKCGHIGTKRNCTTLRTLYYPPFQSDAETEDMPMRCGEHSDYGAITLLFQDTTGGLEVRSVDGRWIPVQHIPDTVLVNLGDLMQRWTSDVYRAAKHRVVFSPKTVNLSRQSIAFFGNPDDEAVIECLDGSNKYPPISALDYIIARTKKSFSIDDT